MFLRKISIENVRSFLERREISFDGPISIIVGPNGGGKTNLLDTISTILRRYLFSNRYLAESREGGSDRIFLDVRNNDALTQMVLERHNLGTGLPQTVEVEIEISQSDIENMRSIKEDFLTNGKWFNEKVRDHSRTPWQVVSNWDVNSITAGMKITFSWVNGGIQSKSNLSEQHIFEYLQLYELDNAARADAGKDTLKTSMIYLPVSRSMQNFQSAISLSTYADSEHKRSIDATTSRINSNIVHMAVGRLAKKYRLLQENSKINYIKEFNKDKNVISLTKHLKLLGYDWKLKTINPLNNEYNILLEKQGSSFIANAASSGERELLTYLFAIYALGVRDALIVIDEPELHLHPIWQTTLFNLFKDLSTTTGNQFILATHSPSFISPTSIQYVSRIYIENQKSNVARLNVENLPNAKHLFNIINSQNNETIFFASHIVLVEGLSDKIFFRKILQMVATTLGYHPNSIPEIISVGGKYLFPSYQIILKECKVPYAIIADLDYLEQIGDQTIKKLFITDNDSIKKDVIDNVKSVDGESLVRHIENALSSGSWEDAKEVWGYIKSRRQKVKKNSTPADRATLKDFINSKMSENIFILSQGALEDYLPIGLKGKDMNKLIEFVESPNLIESMPQESWGEIENIVKCILQKSSILSNGKQPKTYRRRLTIKD